MYSLLIITYVACFYTIICFSAFNKSSHCEIDIAGICAIYIKGDLDIMSGGPYVTFGGCWA